MNLQRNTYAQINIKNLRENIKKIIKKYKEYKYYIGVVKAENYGHEGIESVKAVIEGGCNYLAVATLSEALLIRKDLKDIPILCLGAIPNEYIKEALKNNITITISSLEYMKEIYDKNCEGLKAHLKINTGMNRLGIKSSCDLLETISLAKQKNINLEGIYTHIYEASSQEKYETQLEKFKQITSEVNLNSFKIVHIAASDVITNYEKPSFSNGNINGCRIGIMMYGFTQDKSLDLKGTFSVYSEVIQINNLQKGETVGYNGIYEAKENNEKIAVVPIGYADGIIRKNTGRTVYINDKEYKIVGNICMDMLFVKVDENVKLHNKVAILKDNNHIEQTAKYLDTIPYEIMCSVGKRVERIYVD